VTDDPVLDRRARIARLVALGTRTGYGLFAVAIVLFVVGFATTFTTWITSAIVGCLVAGSLVLAPSIVFGYAVRAAERDDATRT
jgi:hypothetical protein